MANLDLRPLSLGEILDRTFSLYRRNFLLFAGITALPQLLILALNLAQTTLTRFPTPPGQPGRQPVEQFQSPASSGLVAFGIVGVLVGIVVYLVAYLFAQGGNCLRCLRTLPRTRHFDWCFPSPHAWPVGKPFRSHPSERPGGHGRSTFPDHTWHLRGLPVDRLRSSRVAGRSRAPQLSRTQL